MLFTVLLHQFVYFIYVKYIFHTYILCIYTLKVTANISNYKINYDCNKKVQRILLNWCLRIVRRYTVKINCINIHAQTFIKDTM